MSSNKMNRREFLKAAAILGVSATGASSLVVACGQQAEQPTGKSPEQATLEAVQTQAAKAAPTRKTTSSSNAARMAVARGGHCRCCAKTART